MATTLDQVRARIVELQKKMEVLQYEQRQHEQTARDKYAERLAVKEEVGQLTTTAESMAQLAATQSATQAAQQAQRHAETQAAAVQKELQGLQDSKAKLDKLTAELEQRLAALPAVPPADKTAEAPAA